MDNTSPRETLQHLFTSQKLAVLATYNDNQPYCNLMAFAATEDLKTIILATRRQTHKYANIQKHQRVSLLVDNRKNQAEDFQQAMAVTVLATVVEAQPQEYEQFLNLYLFKHPYMASFCRSPECVLLQLQVERYLVVSHFRNFLSLEDTYLQIQEWRP
ncbi:pyridoxamine 5'-phosphate oxidase family protein [Desulfobacca acetoxidans]|nr:pyridoxamine 5'-phosphate oxidase family protein [Desulfobacterales bacterium]